jgi:exodeoxyribonuclease-3
MQETKCADDKFPSLDFKAVGYDCVIFGQQSYNGVAIVSKAGCASVQRGYAEDDASAHSRLLAADVAGIRVVNVMFPTASSSAQKSINTSWAG